MPICQITDRLLFGIIHPLTDTAYNRLLRVIAVSFEVHVERGRCELRGGTAERSTKASERRQEREAIQGATAPRATKIKQIGASDRASDTMTARPTELAARA